MASPAAARPTSTWRLWPARSSWAARRSCWCWRSRRRRPRPLRRAPGRRRARIPPKRPEHRRSWECVRRGEADVVLGSRSALLAPAASGPRHRGRGAGTVVPPGRQPALPRPRGGALVGAACEGAGSLGSATPDVESFYRRAGPHITLTLEQRFLPRSQSMRIANRS